MNSQLTGYRDMDALADNFNKVYPGLSSTHFHESCPIDEPENNGTGKLQQVVLTGIDGYVFPHELMGKASSFATMAKHVGVLKLDCDSVILFEKNGQKYLLLCELKSSYICEDIAHAKDQLIGSNVKMKSLLSSLQGFDKSQFKVIGLIVSFEPTEEQITNISKNEDIKSCFAITLQAKRKYVMPAAKTNRFFHPLDVGEFNLYYIGVPDRQTTYTVDMNAVLE